MIDYKFEWMSLSLERLKQDMSDMAVTWRQGKAISEPGMTRNTPVRNWRTWCVVLAAAFIVAGCSVNRPMVGTFVDPNDTPEPPRQAQATQKPEEKPLYERIATLWERMTTTTDAARTDETAGPASDFQADVALRMINDYRKSNGLGELSLHPQLTEAAAIHASDLANHDRISHFGSDGSDPWDRVQRTGFSPRLAAENVGTGQLTFGEVLRGWKLSPEHNKNLLLADATHVGVAVVNKPDTQFKTFWSLVIGAPNS
jgi:uncharacterized protein YkwD